MIDSQRLDIDEIRVSLNDMELYIVEKLSAKFSELPKTLKYEIISYLLYKRLEGMNLKFFFAYADVVAGNDPAIAKMIREAVVEIEVDLNYLRNPEVAQSVGLEVMRDENYMRERLAQLTPQGSDSYSQVVVMSGGMHLAAGLPIDAEIIPYESSVTSGTKINLEAVLNSSNHDQLQVAVENRHESPIWIVDDVMDTGTTYLTIINSLLDMIADIDKSEIKGVKSLLDKIMNAIKILKTGNQQNPHQIKDMIQRDLVRMREILATKQYNIHSIFAADKISHIEDGDATHSLACFGNMETPPWLMGWGMDTEIKIIVEFGNVSFDLKVCLGRMLREIVALDATGDYLPQPFTNTSGIERLAMLVQQAIREKLGMENAVVRLANES